MQVGTETRKGAPDGVRRDPADPRRQAAEYLDLWEAQVTSAALQAAIPRRRLPWPRR